MNNELKDRTLYRVAQLIIYKQELAIFHVMFGRPSEFGYRVLRALQLRVAADLGGVALVPGRPRLALPAAPRQAAPAGRPGV